MRARLALIVSTLVAANAPALPAPAADHRPFTIPHGNVVIARASAARIPIYRRPDAAPFEYLRNPQPTGGGRTTFLVLWGHAVWTWPDWVHVALPHRPNGASGWIRAKDVTFFLDPYRLRVNLTTRRVIVWKDDRVAMVAPVAVGKGATPTPSGRYYLVGLIYMKNPNGFFGPYVFRTSAFSNVLQTFGGGPGQVGLHGTSQPWLIGKNVSHGCIRMRNADIARLARMVPVGTPFEITR